MQCSVHSAQSLRGSIFGIFCLKINQSAKVRTFNRVETLNLFVTRTKTYSNSDVVLTAPAQKHLSPEENHTQAFKQEELPGAARPFLRALSASGYESLSSQVGANAEPFGPLPRALGNPAR